MNNSNKQFELKRFGKYFAFDLRSCWTEQKTFLLVLALIPVILYVIWMLISLMTNGFTSALVGDVIIVRPTIGARVAALVAASFVFILSFPARSYGFITDKSQGAAWVLLPASRLEKFVSMMLICLVIAPAAFFLTYFVSDALLCLIDPACGESLFSSWRDFGPVNLVNLNNEINMNGGGFDSSIQFRANGLWVVLSNVLQYMSIFLLGALVFKKRKVAKTILTLLAIGMVAGVVMSLLITGSGVDRFASAVSDWISAHLDNMELILNTWSNFCLALVVIGCGVGSWLRVKKVQH